MEKVIIYTTADEIAKGIKKILDEYLPPTIIPTFENEKMSVREGSEHIDVSYVTLCRWIKSGKVPIHGEGRTRFFLRSELIEAYKNLKN